MKDSHKSVIVSLERTTKTERKCKSLMTTVTQEMKYGQSIMCYAKKYGVARASRKYNRQRSTIYFWLSRYDEQLNLRPIVPGGRIRIPSSIQRRN